MCLKQQHFDIITVFGFLSICVRRDSGDVGWDCPVSHFIFIYSCLFLKGRYQHHRGILNHASIFSIYSLH